MKKMILIAALFIGGIGSTSAQCSEAVREAFGGMSSMALYNTYITIGAVADSYVAKNYNSERVQTLMDEQVSMIGAVSVMLDAALSDESGSLSEDDKAYVRSMIACLKSLKDEAQGLHDYALDGSQAANDRYNTNRDQAWAEIEVLLGLNDDE